MVRIVLTTDETLTSDYRGVPLLDFLSCAPVEKVPNFIYSFLETQLPHENGLLIEAPYALRKVEAALLSHGFRREEIVVAHPRYVEKFIDEKTTIVGISTMDPMGLGPVSLMFTDGGRLTSYTKLKFLRLVDKLKLLRKKYGFKLVVGGQGSWQLLQFVEDLDIDHLVIGETEHVIGELFRDIESGRLDRVVRIRSFPSIGEIPSIVGPTYKGMVEVMRGCGRNCAFCSPNLRRARYYPIEKILEEVRVNVRAGIRRAWIHSEDIFLYKLEDHRSFYPNTDEVVRLFETIDTTYRLPYMNPTHSSISPVVADPTLLPKLSRILKAGPDKWVGIQPGLETASPALIRKYMENKPKPFSPEEWPRVVIEGTYMFNSNYWFPAYTAIVGLPGETDEDAMETARLIVTMEKILEDRLGKRARFIVAPLAFTSMDVLKSGSFDPEEHITEGRFLLIYHAWRHIAKEVQNSLLNVMPKSFANRFIFYPLSRLGSWIILRCIRDWGIKKGFDPDKPVKPLELTITLPSTQRAS